ncbi:LuxR family transcriptional regulator [Streptomyces sp. NPDC052052]|uniref:LuxR family transcriptional regulator n=1 Tax=Streptomyces sp. NPDC052052 TaxID=3154756 RepID=UPI00343F39D4
MHEAIEPIRGAWDQNPGTFPGDGSDYRTTMRNVAEALSGLSRAVAERADWTPPAQPATDSPATLPGNETTDSAFHYLNGLPDINRAIQNELNVSRHEILTAQPDGPRPDAVLREALESVRRQLAAGVAMRTLYQHSTRFDEPTKKYVRAATALGARVRTLPEFFDRLIIVDRAVAFIPGNQDRTTAVAVREPAVVGFLADVFARQWDRAEPFPFVPVRAAEAATEVVPNMRGAILKLLLEGRSDREITRRLGLSLRSLQAHVARLKEDHGALHRLQLGYLVGLREQAYRSEPTAGTPAFPPGAPTAGRP